MTLRQYAQDISDASKRVRRAHSGVKVAGTRLIVSVAATALFRFLRFLPNREQVSAVLAIYAIAIVLFVVAFRQVIDQRRFRLVATLIDVAAISLLIKLTGGLETSWFLLYVFPIMSVARYLGIVWSIAVAALAAMAYGSASLPLSSLEAISTLGLRAIMLAMVAFTAAKLARTPYREEESFAEMLQNADQPIVTDDEFDRALARLLRFAIGITKSDFSGIVLLDSGRPKLHVEGHADSHESDLQEIKRLLAAHYEKAIKTRRAVPLAKGGVGALIGGLRSERTKGWTGRLVPLAIGGPPFAVLGVFSRRMIHYRPDDILKLSRMASVVAILQKNSAVSRLLAAEAAAIERLREENDSRLRTLYAIGDILKEELGLSDVFRQIVKIVSERLHSEEAALFLWDEHEMRLFKKAVSGPDAATTKKLSSIEVSYASAESLTGDVFATRREKKINKVLADVSHVGDYATSLPSGCVKHYLGVPLVIGDEILGVIRVLNRKSATYTPEPGAATIPEDGFDDADLELLRMTARLIAVAIRSAGFVEQKRYFENLVYQSPDPIIVLDENKKIKNFNRACTAIWNVEEKEVRGQSTERLYKSPDHARQIGKALGKTKDHMIRDYKAWIRDQSGKIIPIRLSATEFRSKDGRFTGSIGIFNDARGEHEDRLKALANLSRDASHDIKNDVRAITYYFEDLERVSRTYPELFPIYQAIRAAAEAALSKLQSLLMTAVPPPARTALIPIVAEVDGWLASMQDRLTAANVALMFTRPDDDAIVSADREQLRHVLSNLLGNSVDAILEAQRELDSRRIDVTIELCDEQAILQWRDNGIGMPEGAARDAFTAFYTTKENGNGLGLSISRNIVKSHGGDIAIESATGKGTCITITLPLIGAFTSFTSTATENAHV
jgi:PAS domain S-box-containing protein